MSADTYMADFHTWWTGDKITRFEALLNMTADQHWAASCWLYANATGDGASLTIAKAEVHAQLSLAVRAREVAART